MIFLLLLVGFGGIGGVSSLFGNPWIEVELGLVFTHNNTIQIPKEGGTRFNLADTFEQDPTLAIRSRIGYKLLDRHSLSVLISPLTLYYSGTFEQDTSFAGETFPKDTPLEATFKFNSYRLTYRYDLLQGKGKVLSLGFTGKVRDAEITLEANGVKGTKTNIGFVPLIHLYGYYELPNSLFLLLIADALAAPRGRAEDVLVALGYKIHPDVWVRIGYRFLEGGADPKEVYNLA
ncbi:MAG: hypothetical protein SNJ78_08725 [Spirochaetales bacterium]